MSTELRLADADKVRYTIRRNVDAKDKHDRQVKIAMAFCELENGHRFTVAINEDMVAYAGEGIIDDEVRLAAVREKTR